MNFVQLLFRATNLGVSYEYTIANENITRTPEFRWEYMDWSVCTATCGGGTQVRGNLHNRLSANKI